MLQPVIKVLCPEWAANWETCWRWAKTPAAAWEGPVIPEKPQAMDLFLPEVQPEPTEKKLLPYKLNSNQLGIIQKTDIDGYFYTYLDLSINTQIFLSKITVYLSQRKKQEIFL